MQVAAADLRVGDKVLTLEPGGSFCRAVWRIDSNLTGDLVTVHLKSRDGDDGLACTVMADAQITVQR